MRTTRTTTPFAQSHSVRASSKVVAALLAIALAACAGKTTKTNPPKTNPDDKPNSVPSQILATGLYEMVWPGLNYGTNNGFMKHVVAAKDVVFAASLAVGNLDAISTSQAEKTNGAGEDQSVVSLYSRGDAVVDSVAISMTQPEQALFIVSPPGGAVIGELYMADLSQWPPKTKAVTGSNGPAMYVPLGAYFFGPSGNKVLFVEQTPSTGGPGTLDWTDGSHTVKLGSGVFAKTVILSQDRTKAAALTNVVWQGTAANGQGDLIAIDMTSGKSALVASGITAMASAYAPPTGCPTSTDPDCELASAYDLAYTTSLDGRLFAYAKGGVVYLANINYSGEVPVVTQTSLGAGRFPALSGSGTRLAFFDDARNLNVYNVSHPETPTAIGSTPTAGFLCPTFSPDDAYVMYLEKLLVKGNDSRYGSDIGTLKFMPVAPGAVTATYAEHVLWHSLSFWPSDISKATVQLSVVSNVHDRFNRQVYTATNALGDLLVDGPASLPSSGRMRASIPVASSITPSQFSLLPASGGYGILTATSPTMSAQPNADVWLPQSPVVRPGNTQHVAQFVIPGSLQTSASVPGLESVDEVIVSVSNKSYTTPFQDRLERGDLWGAVAGTSSLLKADVFFQTLSTDGRALAIHPQTDAADNKITEIWSLPLLGGR